MCGIAGYFLKPGAEPLPDCLDIMQARLTHRGPDGRDTTRLGRAGFTQTRLAIIDLAGGRQPFVADQPEGRAMLVANGEIYNHEGLRGELETAFTFQSRSDCEVLLPLWLTRPQDLLSAPRGMFAAALYDERSDEGCLMRDPFGIKPLFYCAHDTGLYFASETAALRAIGLGSEAPDRLAAAYVLDKQFAPHPVAPFAGIQKLAAGEQLNIQNGRITGRSRHSPLDQTGHLSEPAGPDNTSPDSQIMDSVDAHQMSDVPFGLFLSGGVDSSVLLASMARLRQDGQIAEHTPKLLAYTARFDSEQVADETELARLLARQTGAAFIDVVYDRNRFFAECGRAVEAMDEPVADYAILPSFALARRARQEVKVVLSGEGGDEFFAGYGRYRAGLRLFGAKWPNRAGPALTSGLLRADVARGLRTSLEAQTDRLPSFADRLTDKNSALNQLQRYDIDSWLPDNLLVKLDRCLMRNGLEGRTPFIDKHLSVYGFHLPFGQKMKGRQGKYALKAWLSDHLPESRPFVRKRGFTVPVGQWIAADAGRLAASLQRLEGLAEVIHSDQIGPLFAAADGKAALLAWRVLFYGLWHQIHVRGVAADQPVLEILNS
ncbi:MAG: asparagine synthase (glutamine-hydrolyzing) [Pseudomonadota bacterium]|nr:asparagine synthase (glutamine-hydrolyzing) [Pseudomonadota bacterium]